MDKLKSAWAHQWVRYALVAIVSLGIGGAIASPTPTPVKPETKIVTQTKEVEKVVYKTPASCVAVINQDNQTFVTIGQGLSNFDFASITDHINKISDKRIADQTDCLAQQ